MRRSVAVCILLLFVPLPVMGQESVSLGEPLQVLDDPTGDYYASLDNALGDGGPSIHDPVPYYTFMDMDWLEVSETEDGFTFTMAVVDLNGPLNTVSFNDGGFFWIHFRHNDWDYRLEIERPSGTTEISYFAILQSKFMDADEWGFQWRDNEGVTWDMSTNTISYTVDRQELADGRGAAPYPGRSLTDFWVIASQRSSSAEADFNDQTVQFPWRLGDRMPDTGIGDIAFPVLHGLDQTGSAFLASDEPFRASNGEATTFLYTVLASNDGSSRDLFSVEAVNAPANWEVELPLAGFELDAGESLAIPVLVTTPFSHQHGGTEGFVLEMRSTTDPDSVGRLELGVRYLATPQPAGHHPAVYLHSIAATNTASFNSAFAATFMPSGDAYFNTLETDPSADEVAVSAFSRPGPADFIWLIPLDPTLRMGLDFDMDSVGATNFKITSPGPMEGVTLEGAFVLRQAGSDFNSIANAPKLATFSDSGRTWSPGASEFFDLEITPQPDGDFVPYKASNEMWLIIQLSGTGVSAFNQNTVPKLEMGGSFTLPMFDYEDDISDAFNALTGARMVSELATRDANPGDIILFDVDLTAREAAVGQYGLALTGSGKDHGAIVTESPVAVGSTPITSTVLVQVPADAADGERIEMFLQATHTTDLQRRGIIRLVVNVDTDLEHDDDALAAVQWLGDEEKESPSPIVPVVALLGVAAWVARRRSP